MLAFTFESGISLALTLLTIVIVPCIAWLIREVLSLRNCMVSQQTEIANIKENCRRHQMWQDEQQKTLARVDKNVVRICERNQIQYDAE